MRMCQLLTAAVFALYGAGPALGDVKPSGEIVTIEIDLDDPADAAYKDNKRNIF